MQRRLGFVRARNAGFPRTIRFAGVAVLLAAVALAGAWFALDPGPLKRIAVMSNVDGLPLWQSPFWRIEIDDHNRYTYRTEYAERHGSIVFAPYAQRFRAIAEIRWSLPRQGTYRAGVDVWAQGSRRTVAPFADGNGSDHRALRDFAAALHDAVVADVRRTNAPRITALDSLDGLQSVALIGRGAMCGSCIWDLSIDASGHARATTYQGTRRFHAGVHEGTVQWSAVTSALREARWGEFDERYGTHASDVAGVRFTFRFPGRAYNVDAPDFAGAPPELLRPFACVMLLATAAGWSPPIEPHGLPDVRGLRLMADQPGLYETRFNLRSHGNATPAPRLGPCKR